MRLLTINKEDQKTATVDDQSKLDQLKTLIDDPTFLAELLAQPVAQDARAAALGLTAKQADKIDGATVAQFTASVDKLAALLQNKTATDAPQTTTAPVSTATADTAAHDTAAVANEPQQSMSLATLADALATAVLGKIEPRLTALETAQKAASQTDPRAELVRLREQIGALLGETPDAAKTYRPSSDVSNVLNSNKEATAETEKSIGERFLNW
jgi:hypothetical protein